MFIESQLAFLLPYVLKDGRLIFKNSCRIGLSTELPRFTLMNTKRSLNTDSDAPPNVAVYFPGGRKDYLVLTKHKSGPDEIDRIEVDCRYTGHLAGEPGACAAVTGCVGREDVELTILSSQYRLVFLQFSL